MQNRYATARIVTCAPYPARSGILTAYGAPRGHVGQLWRSCGRRGRPWVRWFGVLWHRSAGSGRMGAVVRLFLWHFYPVLRTLRAVFSVFVKHVLAERSAAGSTCAHRHHVQGRTNGLNTPALGLELDIFNRSSLAVSNLFPSGHSWSPSVP